MRGFATLVTVATVLLLCVYASQRTPRVPVRITPAAIATAGAASLAAPPEQEQEHEHACWSGGNDFDARIRCMQQQLSLPAAGVPRGVATIPSVFSLGGCAANCSGRGQCQAVRGWLGAWVPVCSCRPGWDGERCEVRDASPCNTYEGGRVLTRCAGSCDDDVNRCYCGAGSRFPARPMPWCVYGGVETEMPWQTPGWANFATGRPSDFWTGARAGGNGAARVRAPPSDAVGARVAWCDADPALRQRPLRTCKCYDGQRTDRMCEPVSYDSTLATFCLNGCSGRGECRSGYCACERGCLGKV